LSIPLAGAPTIPQPRIGGPSTREALDEWDSAPQAEPMPFFSGNSRLKMVIDAIIGAYGLTYITIGAILVLVYVLLQLHVI
jgi:hypothetical protein